MHFYEQAIQKIEPQHRAEFTRYIWSGGASDEFLSYLKRETAAQEAVELVVRKQAEGLEKLAKYLSNKKKDDSITQIV